MFRPGGGGTLRESENFTFIVNATSQKQRYTRTSSIGVYIDVRDWRHVRRMPD